MFKIFAFILDIVKYPFILPKAAIIRMIIFFILSAATLSGCQPATTGGKIPATGKNIPPSKLKQQNEEPKPFDSRVKQESIQSNTPIKIALLLPLSGNYKELGRGMLDAAGLALFKIGNPQLVLLPIDAKDSPSGAIQAAKSAISQDAKIILGPVFSSGAKAIAKIAAENNIQVVSFSNDASLAGTGIFAIGVIPEQQVDRMVNFAIKNGISDFTTILPSDAYGETVTKKLQQIINQRQGTSVLKNEFYKADTQGRIISLDSHVKSVFDAVKSTVSAQQRAMIIPDSGSAIAQIVNTMAKYNFDSSKIKFLGNDKFNDPAILANPALEGAWFTALPNERRKDFDNKFREIYGYDAPKIGGLAFDGVALAATLVKFSDGNGFRRESLINSRGFIGIDGIFRLQENGLTERGFAIMSVQGGRAVLIDAAPNSFTDSKYTPSNSK